jgi:hypothetical protein
MPRYSSAALIFANRGITVESAIEGLWRYVKTHLMNGKYFRYVGGVGYGSE